MTANELCGIEPTEVHWLVCSGRLYRLAFVFAARPLTAPPCCILEADGDAWRLVPCEKHAMELA